MSIKRLKSRLQIEIYGDEEVYLSCKLNKTNSVNSCLITLLF